MKRNDFQIYEIICLYFKLISDIEKIINENMAILGNKYLALYMGVEK